MNNLSHLKAPGFVLESADSVRFGPEYNADEQERNRQVLFGEMLCGLLMGEQLWTNAVFACDSRGAVEVLSAVARAFLPHQRPQHFLPFLLSVYAKDADTWNPGSLRPWANPGELFLRCYAHRLNNTHGFDATGKPVVGFQLSATPELDPDKERRKRIAAEVLRLADTGGKVDDIKTECSPGEQRHFRNILDIDHYLRSWLGDAADQDFQKYTGSQSDYPVRLNRDGWAGAFQDGANIARLHCFLTRAAAAAKNQQIPGLPRDACEVLDEALRLPADDQIFRNRTAFRGWLTSKSYVMQSPVYRVLTELIDGHYVRTQQSVFTFANREVTSPASQSGFSQTGESWASAVMQSCLVNPAAGKSWQFINEIKAASARQPMRIDLDNIAQHFAAYVMHPERWRDLLAFHTLLHQARELQSLPAVQPQLPACLDDLSRKAIECCNHINRHMRSCGVSFDFNPDGSDSGQGSLIFYYHGNRAISQCSGQALEPTPAQSEGASHAIPQP